MVEPKQGLKAWQLVTVVFGGVEWETVGYRQLHLHCGVQLKRGFPEGESPYCGYTLIVVTTTGGVGCFAARRIGGLVLSRLLGCKE